MERKGTSRETVGREQTKTKTVNEVEGAKADSDAAKEFVFAIENVVKDVSLSQFGCEVNEDGLVMIDSGASVNVCPKWFGESILQEFRSASRRFTKITGFIRARRRFSHEYEQEIHKSHRNHAYGQEIHKIQENSCVRAEDAQKSCARADGLQNSQKKMCVRAGRCTEVMCTR